MPAESSSRLTYLAAPYRHPSRAVHDASYGSCQWRGNETTDIDRRVFCPLTYAQALLDHGFDDKDDQWWYEYDVGWLPHCDELVILMLPGWAESEGERIEVEAAERLDIRTTYLEPPEKFIGLTLAQSTELRRRLPV